MSRYNAKSDDYSSAEGWREEIFLQGILVSMISECGTGMDISFLVVPF